MRIFTPALLLISLAATSAQAAPEDGQSRQQSGLKVYSQAQQTWLTPEGFWRDYAKANPKGKYWGQSSSYPEYDQVGEHDTFMVKTPQGVCLMEFFHSRWRRANDVKRWNDDLNAYSGCPYVFN